MSIKVYNSYRVKPDVDMWELSAEIKRIGQDEAKAALKSLHEAIITDPDAYEELKASAVLTTAYGADIPSLDVPREKLTPMYLDGWLKKAFYAQLVIPQKNYFDFSTRVVFRKYDGRIYMRAHFGEASAFRETLLFLDGMLDCLEPYDYWDCTDKPDDISKEEWNTRRDVWLGISQEPYWSNYLVCNIVSPDSWNEISLRAGWTK